MSARRCVVAGVVLAACALVPLARPQVDTVPSSSGIEWPTQWDGAALRPLALSEVEHRFAQRFPGHIARFADDGGRVVVMRHVTQPTRMLHPAADCFRATGYRIDQSRLEHDAQGRLWRCFVATRDEVGGAVRSLRVCERIESVESIEKDSEKKRSDGAVSVHHAGAVAATTPIASITATAATAATTSYTDASSWFWAAMLGESRGPWRATTLVEAL